MTTSVISRWHLVGAGACALTGVLSLPGTESVPSAIALSAVEGQVIRKWYAGWEKKDWRPIDALLADELPFTSAAGDDRKRQRRVGPVSLPDKNGKSFTNVEYLRVTDERWRPSSFPSAVSGGQS